MSLVSSVIAAVVILVVLYIVLSYYYMKTVNLTSLEKANELGTILATDIPGDNSSSNYTYSMWFYVEDWSYRFGEPKILLSKTSTDDCHMPRVVLDDVENNIIVFVGCLSDTAAGFINHECVVKNFPLQSWVNLTISVYGRTLDLYMDGKLVRTCMLPGIAKNSDTDISITPDGGFDGYTANIKYWNDASNPQQVYNIYKGGYGGSVLGSLMSNSYGLKFSFMENNKEKTSFKF